MPGIATPSIVPFAMACGGGAADGVGAGTAAVGATKPAPPSIVLWNPPLGAVAGAAAATPAGSGPAAGGDGAAEAGGADCIGDIAGAKPSIVFMGSFAAGAGAGAAAGASTGAAADTGATEGAIGVASAAPGGANDGAKPIIVLSGTLLAALGAGMTTVPVGTGAAEGMLAGGIGSECGGAPAGSFTAPHWPQNLALSGIGCPH
jgi:DNA polymerase-3 subunit gamma/tau